MGRDGVQTVQPATHMVTTMDTEEIYERTLHRLYSVRPSMECGLTPGCQGSMKPRHSTLSYATQEPYVEDIQVKCTDCLTTQKHGLGLTEAEFEEELDLRDGEKIVNFISAWSDVSIVEQRLDALGYKEL